VTPRVRSLSAGLLSALLAAASLAACGSSSPKPEPGPGGELPGHFSGPLAWAELEVLTSAPRPLGSEGAEAARSHITTRLAASGIAVETISTTAQSDGFGPLALTHLVATLPGSSADRIVLIAPYDSGLYDGFAFVGANDGASGAALLLEIARVLTASPPLYTVELVWLEGEGRIGLGAGEEREQRWLGSRGLAEHWAQTGHLRGIRLLVAFNRVCDADLRMARDLGSHREYREAFWRAARRLGYSDAFPLVRGYETLAASHIAFRANGVRPVVAIEDSAFGGDEPPGLYANSDGDSLSHCSPESLAVVGKVAVDAIDAIATRLAKIDRFARMPALEPEEKKSEEKEAEPAPPAPAPSPAPESPDAAEQAR
jgi:glutaminyl-peptide cyclotransferase